MTDLGKVFDRLRVEAQGLFGRELVSLAVFGSAATADFHPGTSDINAVLVLTETALAQLRKCQELCRRLKKFRLAAPLVMTEAFIRTSADVFPIEFLEIKEKHRLLAGKDCFSRLKIDLKNLRHECEHELKGRLLRLRQSYMEVGRRPRSVQSLLLAAHSANYPAFRTALRLKKLKPPLDQGAILDAIAARFGLDGTVLSRVRQLRRGELRLGAVEITELFEKYSEEVAKLAQAVDRL